jgi:hypothetical protein
VPDIPFVLGEDRPEWSRRLAVLLWLAAWGALLWLVHRPWTSLGGLVGERLRWLERFVLAAGVLVGSGLGEIVCGSRVSLASRLRRVRWLLYAAGVATAAGMVVLRRTGRDDPIGVLASAFVAFLAGAGSAAVGIGTPRKDDRGTNGRSDR